MATTNKKEIAKSVKTLLVLLQSLRDQQVTITLRNDTIVTEEDLFYRTEPKQTISKQQPVETIEVDVDDDSNVNTGNQGHAVYSIIGNDNRHAAESDLRLGDGDDVGGDNSDNDNDNDQSTSKLCDYFIVKGSRIRHIDLPTDIDLLENTKSEIERIRNRCKQWSKRDIVRTTHAYVEQPVAAARGH